MNGQNAWNTYPTVVQRMLTPVLNSLVGKGVFNQQIAQAVARQMQNGGVNDFSQQIEKFPNMTEQQLAEQLENYVRALAQAVGDGRVAQSWNQPQQSWGGGNMGYGQQPQGWGQQQPMGFGQQPQGFGQQPQGWGQPTQGGWGGGGSYHNMAPQGNPYDRGNVPQAPAVQPEQAAAAPQPEVKPSIIRPPKVAYTAPQMEDSAKESKGNENVVKWSTKRGQSTAVTGQGISVVSALTTRIFPSTIELVEFLGTNLRIDTPRYLVRCTFQKPTIVEVAYNSVAPVIDQLRDGIRDLENHTPKNLVSMVADILDDQPLKVVNVIKGMIFSRFMEFLDNKFIHTQHTLNTRVAIDDNSGIEDLLEFTKHSSNPQGMSKFLESSGYDTVISSILSQSIASLFNTANVLSAKDTDDVRSFLDSVGHISLDGNQTISEMYLNAKDDKERLAVSEEICKTHTVIVNTDMVFVTNLDPSEESPFNPKRDGKHIIAGADTCDLDHLVYSEYHDTHPVTMVMTPYKVAPKVFSLGRTVDHKLIVSK